MPPLKPPLLLPLLSLCDTALARVLGLAARQRAGTPLQARHKPYPMPPEIALLHGASHRSKRRDVDFQAVNAVLEISHLSERSDGSGMGAETVGERTGDPFTRRGYKTAAPLRASSILYCHLHYILSLTLYRKFLFCNPPEKRPPPPPQASAKHRLRVSAQPTCICCACTLHGRRPTTHKMVRTRRDAAAPPAVEVRANPP